MLAAVMMFVAILAVAQDQQGAGPLSGEALAQTLDGRWWCTTVEGEAGCSSVWRHDFRQRTVEECGGSDVAWIDWAKDAGSARDLHSVEDVRPLLDSLGKEVERGGYTVIKACRTQRFEPRDGATCAAAWDVEGKPRMWLSRSGRWNDPDDYAFSRSDAERYWWFWPRLFAELEQQGVEEVGIDAEEFCSRFTRQPDGTLVQLAAVGTKSQQENILVEVNALEDVTIIPWMRF